MPRRPTRRQRNQTTTTRNHRFAPRSFCPRLEELEQRIVLATPQPFPYTEGFEASSISLLPGWTVNDGGIGTVDTTTSGTPHGGSRHLSFTRTSGSPAGAQDATFVVDMTSAPGNTWLEFYSKFSSVNLDKLALWVSGDGTNWTSVSESIKYSGGFRANSFDLDQILTGAGVAADSDVYIQFRRNAVTGGSGVLYLDDVRVSAIDSVGPYIKSISLVPGTTTTPVTAVDVTFNEPINPSTFTNTNLISATIASATAQGTGQAVDLGGGLTFRVQLSAPLVAAGGDVRTTIKGPEALGPRDYAGNAFDQTGSNADLDSFGQSFYFPSLIQPLTAFPFVETFDDGLASMARWQTTGARWQEGYNVFEIVNPIPDAESPGGYKMQLIDRRDANNPSIYDSITTINAKVDISSLLGSGDVYLDYDAQLTHGVTTWYVQAQQGAGDIKTLAKVDSRDVGHVAVNLTSTLSAQGINRTNAFTLLIGLIRKYSDPEVRGTIDNVRIQAITAPLALTALAAIGSGTITGVEATFNVEIDPATFLANQVFVYDPSGASVALAGSPVNLGDNRHFVLNFASPQSMAGYYTVTVGPKITDVFGIPLNGNGDAVAGERDDVQRLSVLFGDIQAQTIGYSQGFEDGSLSSLAGWALAASGGTRIVATNENNPRGAYQLELGADGEPASATLKLDLSNQSGASDLFVEFWGKTLDWASEWDSGSLAVEISKNQSTWATALTAKALPVGIYAYFSFDLDQVLTSNAMSVDGDVYVRFRRLKSDLGLFAIDDVRVDQGPFNRPPILTAIQSSFNLTEDLPHSRSYASLVTSSGASDPDPGATLHLRIESVTTGTLTKDGVAVVPGDTLLGPGESLVWTPPLNLTSASTYYEMYRLRAWDGINLSSTDFRVSALLNAANDAPALNPSGILDALTFREIDPTRNRSRPGVAGMANWPLRRRRNRRHQGHVATADHS